jgi:hypothetical protein
MRFGPHRRRVASRRAACFLSSTPLFLMIGATPYAVDATGGGLVFGRRNVERLAAAWEALRWRFGSA